MRSLLGSPSSLFYIPSLLDINIINLSMDTFEYMSSIDRSYQTEETVSTRGAGDDGGDGGDGLNRARTILLLLGIYF